MCNTCFSLNVTHILLVRVYIYIAYNVSTCMYVCIYIYICVYIYKHIETQISHDECKVALILNLKSWMHFPSFGYWSRFSLLRASLQGEGGYFEPQVALSHEAPKRSDYSDHLFPNLQETSEVTDFGWPLRNRHGVSTGLSWVTGLYDQL